MGMNMVDFCNTYEKIYVFGNSEGGRYAAEYLDYYQIPYLGHIISEKYEKNPVGEHPVYYLSEIEPDENTGIILGCYSQYLYEVLNLLMKRGFNNVHSGGESRCVGYAMNKLKGFGVDLTKEVLDMKEFKLANLFPYGKKDLRAMWTYSDEFPDLGYHYLGDVNCFVEGPYEFENVTFEEDGDGFDIGAIENVRLHKDDVVFDCGANIGMFSVAAAAKGCQVYAFEPSPDQISYLGKNRDLYPNEIHIVQKAVADYNGTAQFNLCPGFNGGDSLVNEFNDGQTVDVQVTSLDSFVEENGIERVDFIKADLEGAETMLLRGATAILKKYQPVLSLCTYHKPTDAWLMTKIIREANPKYKITYGWKKLYAWVE